MIIDFYRKYSISVSKSQGVIVINKVYSLLGLAKRAGRLSSGESGCKDAVRFGKSRLIVIAADTGTNTRKSISDSCAYYGVPIYTVGTMTELGHAVGNRFNAVLSVNDEGFAKSIEKQICANINGGE